MEFSPRDMVVLFSGFLGVLLGAYLLWQPGKNVLAGRLLAAFLCCQGGSRVVSVFLFRHFLYSDSPTLVSLLFYLESSVLVLEGMLLYAWCAVLLLNSPLKKATVARHLLFAAALWVVSITVYAQADVMSYFNPVVPRRPAMLGFTYSLIEAVRCVYALLCLGMVNRYKSRMLQQCSNLRRSDTLWLFTLIRGFVAYCSGWLFINLNFALAAVYQWQVTDPGWVAGGLMLLLDLSWLCVHIGLIFFGLKYSNQFHSLEAIETTARPRFDPALVGQLNEVMQQQKPYTNPELRLDDLATLLRQSPKTVSNLINQHYQSNFCEFINQFRIEEAKRLLVADKKHSVLDISLDVGFNSKSAFNRAFKKLADCTPLAYRKTNS